MLLISVPSTVLQLPISLLNVTVTTEDVCCLVLILFQDCHPPPPVILICLAYYYCSCNLAGLFHCMRLWNAHVTFLSRRMGMTLKMQSKAQLTWPFLWVHFLSFQFFLFVLPHLIVNLTYWKVGSMKSIIFLMTILLFCLKFNP